MEQFSSEVTLNRDGEDVFLFPLKPDDFLNFCHSKSPPLILTVCSERPGYELECPEFDSTIYVEPTEHGWRIEVRVSPTSATSSDTPT